MKYVGTLHNAGKLLIPNGLNAVHLRQYINQYNYNIIEYMNKKPQNAGNRQWNIYQVSNRTYHQQLKETKNSDLTLLCPLNVEGNTSHFYKLQEFVKELINYTFNMGHKNIAIVALNEPFEYLNLDGYFGWCLDIRNGILQSKRPSTPIIIGNEKIKTSTEQHYYSRMITDYIWRLHKNIYIGFQSLGTSASRMKEYFEKAQDNNWKIMDVEFGDECKEINHYDTTKCLNNLKNKFNLELTYDIEGCFLVFPYQKQNAYYNRMSFNFIDNNLNIVKKRKAWNIKNYILSKWKPIKEDKLKIAKYYQKEDFGDSVIDWIQAQLIYQGYLSEDFKNFGTFDVETEEAVIEWQEANGVASTGKISKYHIYRMTEQSPEGMLSAFINLIIYAS